MRKVSAAVATQGASELIKCQLNDANPTIDVSQGIYLMGWQVRSIKAVIRILVLHAVDTRE